MLQPQRAPILSRTHLVWLREGSSSFGELPSWYRVPLKAELNLFEYRCVPTMKLNSINLSEFFQNWSVDEPSLIERCQLYDTY